MPSKFVETYGGELSSSLRLRVPMGSIWDIGLEREGKMLWLHEGFQKFMEHYRIRWGYFLIFKYKGHSELNVHVFDLTATEINYPCSAQPERPDLFTWDVVSEKPKVFIEGDVIEILDSPVASPTHCSIEDDALKECSGQEVLCRSQKQCPTIEEKSCALSELQIIHKGERHNHKRSSCNGTSNYSQRRKATEKERKMALDAAKRLKPGYPSFMAILEKHNVKKSCILSIPAEFSRVNLSIKEGNYIKLQDSNGGKWPIWCIHVRGGKAMYLSKGWSKFVKENNLDVGDVCVFELIGIDDITLKVSLFRTKQDA